MSAQHEVIAILDEALSPGGCGRTFTREAPFLGEILELDSMAVVNVLAMLEDRFDFVVEGDEINGVVFETVGSLVELINQKFRCAS